jgi:hypothetical protein
MRHFGAYGALRGRRGGVMELLLAGALVLILAIGVPVGATAVKEDAEALDVPVGCTGGVAVVIVLATVALVVFVWAAGML